MKKSLTTFLLLGVFILIAIFTNPDVIRHKEVVNNKITEYMQQKMKEHSSTSDNELGDMGQVIGAVLGGTIIEKIVDNIVSTDNYILFSTTKITWDGNTRVVGIGAFGNVFLSSKMDGAVNDEMLKSKEKSTSKGSNRSYKSMDFLKELNGKQPYDVKLFENQEFAFRLKKLLGNRYEFLKETWAVEPPMEFAENVFTATGCEAHNCGATNFIIVYDFTSNVMSVGIREEFNVETYSEDGTTPSEITDWMNP